MSLSNIVSSPSAPKTGVQVPWADLVCNSIADADGPITALTVGATVNATNNDGGIVTANVLHLERANSLFSGLVSNTVQNFSGAKTFDSLLTAGSAGFKILDPAVVPLGILRTDGTSKVLSGTVNLASADVSGKLPVVSGGTNSSVALVNPFSAITTNSTATEYQESVRFKGAGDNLFIGFQSGNDNLTLTGTNNLAISPGIFSNPGLALTTGSDNTLICCSNGLTTGSANVCVGVSSGQGLLSASECIAMGPFSLNSHNVGPGCIAIGGGSLANDTAGSDIVAIGRFAGNSAVNCDHSQFLGAQATSTGTFTNSTALGYASQFSVSNGIVLGNSCAVGIGNDSPLFANYALSLGSAHGVLPRLHMESSAVAAAPGVNEGILENNLGKLNYVSGNPNLSGTVGTYKSGGADDTAGQVVLNGVVGTPVATTAIQLTSIVHVSASSGAGAPSGNEGFLTVSNIVAGTSFTIFSSNALDVGGCNWSLINV